MFKSRRKQAEKEAREDPNYIPTKELEADEEKPEFHFPWTALFIVGGLLILIIACIIVIKCVGAI